MKFHPPKIQLFFIGSIFQKERINFYINEIPELRVIANVEPVFFYKGETADIGPKNWLELAMAIRQSADTSDGIVVVHDIENLLYTASALSFLLCDLSKPIVFTGSLNPQARDSGIKSNIINSCQLVSHKIAEVCLLFGNKVLRANQASRNFPSSLNLFQAPESGLLGQIDFSIRLFNRHRKPAEINTANFTSGLVENISILTAGPLMNSSEIKDKNAVVIKVDQDPIPLAVLESLELVAKNLPIVIFDRNKIMNKLDDNFIYIDNMIFEAVVTKLMFALSQSGSEHEVRKMMVQDVNGEIIV